MLNSLKFIFLFLVMKSEFFDYQVCLLFMYFSDINIPKLVCICIVNNGKLRLGKKLFKLTVLSETMLKNLILVLLRNYIVTYKK